jgi:hypothetical protein
MEDSIIILIPLVLIIIIWINGNALLKHYEKKWTSESELYQQLQKKTNNLAGILRAKSIIDESKGIQEKSNQMYQDFFNKKQ